MKKPAATSFVPDRTQENLLLFSVFFVAAPHLLNLGWAIVLYFSLMAAWRFASGYRPALLPGRLLLFLLTLSGAALVYVDYHRFYGREAGSSLFLVGLGLKLMEMRNRRDVYLVVYLAFFVALTQYLFSQSIALAVYTLAAVALLISVLIGLNAGPVLSLKTQFRMAASLVAQAMPIMVVLFIFFPRIAGPLWKLPDDPSSAKTGLSDIIEPGSVSRLALSREPAFRADFEGPLPLPAERYWRGPVFWHTDGRRWTLPPERGRNTVQAPAFSGPAYRYTITLEPHQKRWVFALDLPKVFPENLAQTPEYLLLTPQNVGERRQYTISSYPNYRTGELSPAEREQGLQLPDRPSARMLRLVERWRRSSSDPKDIVNNALLHFREEPFVYTLNPPVIRDKPVDIFLFETRKGFCEHYATAFVYLMRVAGIPARVVTGYQGGQWNPVGKFLEVRQADAHAWTEVWLSEQGWTRVDPTAAVAPHRIEQGIDLDRQMADHEVSFSPVGRALADAAFDLHDWYDQARLIWASIDHAWNQRVLSYNPENQKRFWEALGIVDWRGLITWLTALLILCGVLVGLWLRPRRKPKAADPAMAAYNRFLKKMAKNGLVKQTGEGPRDFALRAASERPEAKEAIGAITTLFLRIRYGRQADPRDIDQLRRRVRAFRV
ncbi:transglutaminase TgpA family protein [Methylocaldum gracile subsp. desertum]|uniref:transglutaminase TgpA family protein n=1 Tax=Methylocaldum sp. GT1BW TaxID=3438964 RepID=UPI003DA009A6